MDLTIGTGHGLIYGNPVKLLPESLVFTCTKDGNATEHRYPQGGDPYWNSAQISKINSNTEVEINVGPSTTPSNFVGGGTIQGAILHLEYKTILQVGEMLLQMVHLLRR